MFAGKTTELLRRTRRFAQYKKCLLVAYKGDDRYGSDAAVITHDKNEMKAKSVERLSQVENEAHVYSVIGIDEGQFFPDIVEYAERWANQGKIVIISALDGTFQRKPFNCILELIPLAEEVIKLRAVCNGCRREAAFTHRLGTEQEVEVVGGAENYVAVCRKCYHSYMDSKNAPAAPPGTPTSVARPKRRSSRLVAGSGQHRRASSPLPASDIEERRLSLQALTLR
ncbi:Thymidine kinase [Coccomyxa sp. Obi]|nr:Thymidine kinase [Coccomyxa sp. Obi]